MLDFAPSQSMDASTTYEVIKRILDWIASVILLALFAPLMLVVGLLVRLTSNGPSFFKQKRVGLKGEYFEIVKFRTMVSDAESFGPQVTSADDQRITRIGRVLRATKIDELPQLFNVFTGDMSLVGPRPQVPRYVEAFDAKQREIILTARPGITGPTAIKFRHEERILESRDDREGYYLEVLLPIKCQMDTEYVSSRSLYSDGVILFQTLILFCRGVGHRLIGRPLGKDFEHPVPEVLESLDFQKHLERPLAVVRTSREVQEPVTDAARR